jgi:hypothetical protein
LFAKLSKLLLVGLIAGKKVITLALVMVAAGLHKLWIRRKSSGPSAVSSPSGARTKQVHSTRFRGL